MGKKMKKTRGPLPGITRREWEDGDGRRQVRWDVVVFLGWVEDPDGDGRKKDLHCETFETCREAEAKVLELKGRKNGGGPRPVSSTITFGDWLERWLEIHSTQVRAGTLHGYRGIVRRWITDPPDGAGVPRLAKRRLRDLTVDDFDRLYLFMHQHGQRGWGIKPKTIRATHVVFRRALKDAVRKGIMGRNPTDGVTIPKAEARAVKGSAEKKKVRAMGQQQAGRFVAAVREDRHSALWHVLLFGGLRPTESFALEWKDVDWEAGAVKVQGSLNRRGLDPKKHPNGWQLTAPKTKSSNRTVPLPAIAMNELEAWRTQQKRDRLAAGPEWQDHGFVFTTYIGTPLDLTNLRRTSFRNVMEAAGLGTHGPEPKKPRSGPTARRPFKPSFRIYDLRHTCASLLLKGGHTLKEVQEHLGHGSIRTTADVYGHLIDDMAQGAARTLGAMFGTG